MQRCEEDIGVLVLLYIKIIATISQPYCSVRVLLFAGMQAAAAHAAELEAVAAAERDASADALTDVDARRGRRRRRARGRRRRCLID